MRGDEMFRRMRAALRAWSLRRVSRVVMLLSLMAAMGVCAGAQTAVDGAIRGDVRSVSGGAIPLGEVRVTGRDTGVELRAVTDKQGEFVLARVPPGEYEVRVEANGFEPQLVEGVVVEVGGVGEVAVRLSVAKQGAGSGLSVVNAPVKNVEDGSATVLADTTGASELDGLPSNGERWQAFAELIPAASQDATGAGLLSFAGLPATQNRTTVDGASDDQSFNAVPRGAGGDAGQATEDEIESGFSSAAGRGRAFGVGTARQMGAVSTFSQEAVREFRVSVQNYSAVFGHGARAGRSTRCRRAERMRCMGRGSIWRGRARGERRILTTLRPVIATAW